MQRPAYESWDEVDLADLLGAFRKAKADCFFERSTYCAEDFTAYERDLFGNLGDLLSRLRSGEVSTAFERARGKPRVFAKTLGTTPKQPTSQCFFSDARRAFERLHATHDLVPEFRLVGDFGVDMHVLSGLWINCIGHKYDARLRGHAFGSRVRRYGSSRISDRPTGDYQYDAVGSFEPYFRPYRDWRDGGMAAIKSALEADEAVVALTLDFSSYYHNIDPAFVADPDFLATIGLDLNDWEISFTRELVAALQAWSRDAGQIIGPGADSLRTHQAGGLPIGLSAVRIITNVLLFDFDERILDALAPVYYGRYVDDIFLVIRDSGKLTGTPELWDYIRSRADIFQGDDQDGEVEIKLDGHYQANTRLILKRSKQKVFFLQGQSGLDLLNNIGHQVRELSSERRLMPLAEEMDTMASARALAAATGTAEEPDSLRRADGLTLRRLGWALQLRSAEILARDLDRKAWSAERQRFYQFACVHILRPDKILEHIDGLARLISLAASLADWSDALQMYRKATDALRQIETALGDGQCKINGQVRPCTPSTWTALRDWVRGASREAVLRGLPWDSRTGGPQRLTRTAIRLLLELGVEEDEAGVQRIARELREADWGKRPYKDHLRLDADRERPAIEGEDHLPYVFAHHTILEEFLKTSRSEDRTTGVRRLSMRAQGDETNYAASLLPFILATRPYTAQEIALYQPTACIFAPRASATRKWAAYCQAIRGTPQFEPDASEGPSASSAASGNFPVVDLGGEASDRLVRLGITSLKTLDGSWALGASGRPDRSAERYKRLATIVNQAVRASPRPTHLLLPELSVPEGWLDTLSAVLLDSNISLIAGLDYDHHPRDVIDSSAALILQDDRLGFRSSVQIRQPKLQAAPHEEEELLLSHGKTWTERRAQQQHPVYIHRGLYFGVLVCSELQNIGHRQRFQGEVDLLAVLSWNKDLETFSALVESASLDVHAYIALVNNRAYGDSRVRSPRRDAHARDVCRIRGGENDHLVVVEIDPAQLRAQQSRARRWVKAGDRYKPAPEGFMISPARRRTPS